MEEELVIFVSEKDLEEFPETDIEDKVLSKEHSQTHTAVEKKEEIPVKHKEAAKIKQSPKIPSLLDLKIPEVYATRRNGRRSGNQRTAQKKVSWSRVRSRWGK